jgi:Zn finger protein HypA/HybF involved in hydrogenase expression
MEVNRFETMKIFRFIILLLAAVNLFAGCGKSDVDRALDSDANGFLCLKCQAKFYTDRKVFPTRCPQCQNPKVELVMGFVCSDDKHITYAPQGRGSAACEQCKKPTSALSIPREAELKAWGATKKTKSEVGG